MTAATAACPTDSPWKTPLPGFGVDTVRLRGPATDELLAQLPDKRYRQSCDGATGLITEAQRSGYTVIPVGATTVRVQADRRSGSPEVAVEFSAPSMTEGHNRHPLPVALLSDVAATVWAKLNEELSGLPAFDRLRLTRIDLDRDFTAVSAIPDTLWATAQRPASRCRTDRLERGASGHWQSLSRGNKGSWLAVAYGKQVQLTELSDAAHDPDHRALLQASAATTEGVMRWELQLRREKLRHSGLHQLQDLDEDELYAMSRHHFSRTRFDEPVAVGPQRLLEVVGSLRPSQQRGVLATLAAELIGLVNMERPASFR